MSDTAGRSAGVDPEPRGPVAAARELLDAARLGEDPAPALRRLARFDTADLEPVRTDRSVALAFWSNLYNAGTQLLLEERPGLYESPFRTVRFFRAPVVDLGGTSLSLDDVEHGVLRANRSKYGLGYLPRLVSGGLVRRHALDEPDPRVHFALNCGAESCPAVRYYEPDHVDTQLDRAAESYLSTAVEYDPERDVATVPQLFRWYRGDFGGPDGIRSILGEYGVVPAEASPALAYRAWDWTRRAGKFVAGADRD
jgi:hypothetical protein